MGSAVTAMRMTDRTRRNVLATLGAVGVGALTGCGQSTGERGTDTIGDSAAGDRPGTSGPQPDAPTGETATTDGIEETATTDGIEETVTTGGTETPAAAQSPCELRGSTAAEPTVQTEAESVIGDPFLVRLDGFDPNTTVAVTFEATDSRGVTYERTAEYRTNGDGVAAAEACPPGRGRTLLADLQPDAAVTPPTFVVGSQRDIRVDVTASVDEQRLATASTTRVYRQFGLDERRLTGESGAVANDAGLYGRYFEPPGDGPFPAVVTLHGSEARRPDRLSRLLATQGYATLALQYFGTGRLPPGLRNVPLSYFADGIRWLHERAAVRSDAVGLVGISRGVEAALFAAADFDGPTAVVGYSGSGLAAQELAGSQRVPPWTRDGVPIATAEQLRAAWDTGPDSCIEQSCAYEDPSTPCPQVACLYEAKQSNAPAALDATTPDAGAIDGPVLLVTGRDDQLWPGPLLSEFCLAHLDAGEFDDAAAHYSYRDAGHVLHLPYQSYEGLANDRYGGSQTANARAATAAWPRVLDTLADGLR